MITDELLRLLRLAAVEAIPVAPRVRVGREGDAPEDETWWCVATGYSAATGIDEPIIRIRWAVSQMDAVRSCARALLARESATGPACDALRAATEEAARRPDEAVDETRRP